RQLVSSTQQSQHRLHRHARSFRQRSDPPKHQRRQSGPSHHHQRLSQNRPRQGRVEWPGHPQQHRRLGQSPHHHARRHRQRSRQRHDRSHPTRRPNSRC